MSSLEERRHTAEAGLSAEQDGFPARVFLQPIAAPSILGLAGFAGATFIVPGHARGGLGHPRRRLYLWLARLGAGRRLGFRLLCRLRLVHGDGDDAGRRLRADGRAAVQVRAEGERPRPAADAAD